MAVRSVLQGENYGEGHERACEGLAIARAKSGLTRPLWVFTVVRNPFAWLSSLYRFSVSLPEHPLHPLLRDRDFSWFLFWYVNEAVHIPPTFGFNRYQRLVDFIRDDEGNEVVDYVAKLENIKQDWPVIADRTCAARVLPLVNETKLKELPSYRDRYSKVERQLVEAFFEEDLERFGYEF